MAVRVNQSVERNSGAYETPLLTARYMAQKVASHVSADARILDPAVGNGVFLRALMDEGLPPPQLHGFDLDAHSLAGIGQMGCSARHADFLDYVIGQRGLLAQEPLFDGLICNPPYNCHESAYLRSKKESLRSAFGHIGTLNTYSLFLAAALEVVRPDGIICMLVMDSFLTNVLHRALRQLILETTDVIEILLAPRNLFHSQSADVRTAIVTLRVRPVSERRSYDHVVRTIDRIRSERDYEQPPISSNVPQRRFLEVPEHLLYVGVPDRLVDIYCDRSIDRLGDVFPGGAGISTGNDRWFLRRRDELPYGDASWVPFHKNCGGRSYTYEPEQYIQRDWETSARHSKSFIARNTSYYFREGVTCSSMGIRFSACHMPPGGLFGVNANFFPEDREALLYLLGFLNSQLASYYVRALLNRTNMVTPGYVKKIPFVRADIDTKRTVSAGVARIMEAQRQGCGDEAHDERREIDELIFDLYGLSRADRATVQEFCADIYERL